MLLLAPPRMRAMFMRMEGLTRHLTSATHSSYVADSETGADGGAAGGVALAALAAAATQH
jgi:hypothetical protein